MQSLYSTIPNDWATGHSLRRLTPLPGVMQSVYSTVPPDGSMIIKETDCMQLLLHCRDADGLFYKPSQLSQKKITFQSVIWALMQINHCRLFICTQLKSFKHHYVTLTIRFSYSINKFQVFLINTNNSIQLYWFVISVKLFLVLLCITNNSIKH